MIANTTVKAVLFIAIAEIKVIKIDTNMTIVTMILSFLNIDFNYFKGPAKKNDLFKVIKCILTHPN